MEFNTLKQTFHGNKMVFIYDENGTSILRAIPLLNLVGVNIFTYPFSWTTSKQLPWLEKKSDSDFIEYQYYKLSTLYQMKLNDPLCCITNQFYEKSYPIYSIHPLLSKSNECKFPLTIIADSPDFQIHGKIRPLKEEVYIGEYLSYKFLFDLIKKTYKLSGLNFPLRDTKNVYFQINALFAEEISNIRIQNLFELIEIQTEIPYLPLWNFWAIVFDNGVKFSLNKEEINNLVRFFCLRVELTIQESKEFVEKILDQLLRINRKYYFDLRTRRKELKKYYAQIYSFLNYIENDDLKEYLRGLILWQS